MSVGKLIHIFLAWLGMILALMAISEQPEFVSILALVGCGLYFRMAWRLPGGNRDNYHHVDGYRCPACRSTDVVGHSYDVLRDTVTQEMTCNLCDAAWDDVYTLTAYRNLRDGG